MLLVIGVTQPMNELNQNITILDCKPDVVRLTNTIPCQRNYVDWLLTFSMGLSDSKACRSHTLPQCYYVN